MSLAGYVILKNEISTMEKETEKETSIFSISGMTCASCAVYLANEIEKSPNVVQAKIDLLGHRAVITHSSTVPLLLAVITGCGFSGTLIENMVNKVRLVIDGMTCASCSSYIEEKMSQMPGIQTIQVSLLTKLGDVQYNSETIGVRDIIKQISDLGFKVTLASQGPTASLQRSQNAAELKLLKHKFLRCLMLSVPIFFLAMIFPLFSDGIDYKVHAGLSIGEFLGNVYSFIPAIYNKM